LRLLPQPAVDRRAAEGYRRASNWTGLVARRNAQKARNNDFERLAKKKDGDAYLSLSALLSKCWITIQSTANRFKVTKVARIQCVLMARTYIGSSELFGNFA
jgi:hypothetical protein